MPRNHIKLLTVDQLETLNATYFFELDDDEKNIVVKLYSYDRQTLHPLDQGFSINSKIRKISFSTEAIEIWSIMYKENPSMSTTLFDVQQAVNRLSILYQIPEVENVKSMISAYPVRYLREE